MQASEKEVNCNLFDQLFLLGEIEEAAQSENAAKTLQIINKKRRRKERKLYQTPPLIPPIEA